MEEDRIISTKNRNRSITEGKGRCFYHVNRDRNAKNVANTLVRVHGSRLKVNFVKVTQ